MDSADIQTRPRFDTPDGNGVTCRERVTQLFLAHSMTFGLAEDLENRFWRRFDEPWDSEPPHGLRRFYQWAGKRRRQDEKDFYACFARRAGH